MSTIRPSATALFVVAMVASVGYAEAEPGKTTGGKTLSVAPLHHEIYPEDRPSWIRDEPDLESEVHQWVVTTSGRDTIQECEAELDVLKRATVALYIKQRTGWICGDDVLDEDWIENDLIGRRYIGTLKKGDQELHEIAVELQFDDEAQQRIDAQWKNTEVNERLKVSGAMFGLLIIGLCCSGGLLGAVSRRYS